MGSNVSFDPSDPSSPYYNPQDLYSAGTNNVLGLSQSQLDSIQKATAASSAFGSGMSLLEYRSTVSTANIEQDHRVKADRLFESTQYKPVRWDAALTAEYFRGLIEQYSNYMDEREQLDEDIQDALSTLNSARNTFQSAINTYNSANNAFNNAVTTFNNYNGGNDPTALQNARNAYNAAVTNYNNNVAPAYNNARTAYINAVSAFNAQNFNGRITTLNTLASQIGLTVAPNNVPNIAAFTSTFPVPDPRVSQSFSPPMQPGVNSPAATGDGTAESPYAGSPYSGQTGLRPIAVNDAGLSAAVTRTPDAFTRDQFQETVIDPLKALIDSLVDVNEQVDGYIVYQNYVQLAFGQQNLEAGVDETEPVSQDVSTSGTGTSLATASSNNANPDLPAAVSSAALEQIYLKFDIYPTPDILALIADLGDTALSLVVNSRTVPTSAQAVGSGLVGPTPNTSPTITTATALTALGNLGDMDALLAQNNIDLTHIIDMITPFNAGKSPEEIAEIAQGILAAIKLQVAEIVILQVEKVIGAPGLLAQILANAGSIDADTILKLTQGLISYKNLFDSPIAAQGFIDLTSAALQAKGLTKEEADRIATQSYENAQALYNDDSYQAGLDAEDRAKQAFLDGTQEALAQNNIDAAEQEDYLSSVEASLDDADANTRAFQETTTRDLARYELDQELNDKNIDEDDRAKLDDKLDDIRKQNLSKDEENAAYVQALQDAGIEDAQALVDQANAAAANPLRSFEQTSVLTTDEIGSNFNSLVVGALDQPGARIEDAEATADNYTDILVQGPNSIVSLVASWTKDYDNAIGEQQGDQAVELFADGLTFNWDSLRLSNEVYSPANFLVYSDQISMQGVNSRTMGPGTPAGTGYVNNDKFV